MLLCAGWWVILPSVSTRLPEILGGDRAGLLSQMAQVSLQFAGWFPACPVRAHPPNTGQVTVMILLAQVVILRWEEGDEEHKQKLYNIELDGSGRLDWAAVEKAFGADLVEIKDEGLPGLLQEGDMKGLTRATFQPGSTIPIIVSRNAQGEN